MCQARLATTTQNGKLNTTEYRTPLAARMGSSSGQVSGQAGSAAFGVGRMGVDTSKTLIPVTTVTGGWSGDSIFEPSASYPLRAGTRTTKPGDSTAPERRCAVEPRARHTA